MKKILTLLLLPLLLAQARLSSAGPRYSLQRQWSTAVFSQPLDLQFIVVRNREYACVVQQGGQIIRVRRNSNGADAKAVLDLSSRIVLGGEQGLLGLAIHPRFSGNGFIFVHYSRASDGASVVSRFTVDRPSLTSDLASEKIFLVVPQPFANHNAGGIVFGADGFLYIPMGDGGGQGDPQGVAQDLTSLLGKVLRIDVDREGSGVPYSIPSSNPFIIRGVQRARPEIFALGFRNPFKISRDMAGSRIWLGDVGQSMREEIDILKRGANYGWNRVEGNLCYPDGVSCDIQGLEKPAWSLTRAEAKSITGGYVYRGNSIPSLRGKYVYGDFITGNIWSLAKNRRTVSNSLLIASGRNISSFGQDSKGEVYVVDYSGQILRLSK
jgi:glucose/arabinose dehydrogenase